MNCEILRTFYIKADGQVLCNDDYGERVILADLGADRIPDLFQNGRYTHIRDSLARDQAPWEGICEHCAFLRPGERIDDRLAHRQIDKIQVESSITCTLKCPICASAEQMRVRRPVHLSCDLFEAALTGLKESGYRIGAVEYCGQGEPLMNPQFERLSLACRDILPETTQRLITNGNFSFETKIGRASIDEIIVSCDGCRAESYSQYRIGGTLDLALKFLADAAKARQRTGCRVIWKYILFWFNDSDDELIEAQDIAYRLGIDVLLFTFSHSPQRSRRLTLEKAAMIPRIHDNVAINAHPSYYKNSYLYRSESAFRREERLIVQLDEIRVYSDGTCALHGWMLAETAVATLNIAVDGIDLGSASLTVPRPDVLRTYPRFSNHHCGFRWSGIVAGLKPDVSMRVEISFVADGMPTTINGVMSRIASHV